MLSFKFQKRLPQFMIDLELKVQAETLVLIGHSGSGKSTTLRILAGLLEPDHGQISLENRLLFDSLTGVSSPAEQREIGMVFQNYALFPHLTVRQNIGYGLSKLEQSERDSRIEGMLDQLGLRHLAENKPKTLSGGEQQRVALARALVTHPKLLLLDEPLSALDVTTRSRVRADLQLLLNSLSIPTLVVTHDYEDARVLGDRIAVMDQGKLIQIGTPDELTAYPANPFVAQFTGSNFLSFRQTTDSGIESTVNVSFDPWQVTISNSPQQSEYEWNGTIRDRSWLGAYIRLHLAAEEASFFADLPRVKFNEEDYGIGKEVFVQVPSDQIRFISVDQVEFNQPTHTNQPVESTQSKFQPNGTGQKTTGILSNRRRWLGIVSAAVFLGLFAGGFLMKNITATRLTTMPVLVAANATDPMNAISEQFEKDHPVKIETTYAGTQILRTQLENGANADLFLSADLAHIQALKAEGAFSQFFPVSKGHEVIVVPKQNPAGIDSLQDLATKPVRLIIGVDTVPIGKYTREVFTKAQSDYGSQFTKQVMSHVISMETNVKQVLQLVSLKEADAGIVYRTDISPDFNDKVLIINIPDKYNVVATNYIAVPTKAPHPKLGQELLNYMLSDQGQTVFAKFHYDPLK